MAGFYLAAAGNTTNPCLNVLREKGYELWREEQNDMTLWFARQDSRQFLAYSPAELLGLVALWEHYGDDWNHQEPDVYESLEWR
jgi:hypothetical protein